MDNSDKTRTSSHDSWVVWDLNGYLDGISLIKNEMANVEPEESAKHYFFRGQASYDWIVWQSGKCCEKKGAFPVL